MTIIWETVVEITITLIQAGNSWFWVPWLLPHVGGLVMMMMMMVMVMMLEDHNNGHEDGCDHLPIDDNDDNIIGKITMIMIRNVIFTFEYQ